MSDLEPLRDIIKRLWGLPRREPDPAMEIPEPLGVPVESESIDKMDGIDREWLREMGIDA